MQNLTAAFNFEFFCVLLLPIASIPSYLPIVMRAQSRALNRSSLKWHPIEKEGDLETSYLLNEREIASTSLMSIADDIYRKKPICPYFKGTNYDHNNC